MRELEREGKTVVQCVCYGVRSTLSQLPTKKRTWKKNYSLREGENLSFFGGFVFLFLSASCRLEKGESLDNRRYLTTLKSPPPPLTTSFFHISACLLTCVWSFSLIDRLVSLTKTAWFSTVSFHSPHLRFKRCEEWERRERIPISLFLSMAMCVMGRSRDDG